MFSGLLLWGELFCRFEENLFNLVLSKMFRHILYLIISILDEAKNGWQFLLLFIILNFRRAKT